MKRGRTTFLTEGTIEVIHGKFKIGDDIIRVDCVAIRADEGKHFSQGGDSGSPVVSCEDNKLIGLHFAGNGAKGGISVFCTIENVFQNLAVKLPK